LRKLLPCRTRKLLRSIGCNEHENVDDDDADADADADDSEELLLAVLTEEQVERLLILS
jgi:selenophosphate synthase